MQSFLSLDNRAGETFAYEPQGSRFEAKFPQLRLWVVQLVWSKPYGDLLRSENKCSAPTQQQISLINHNKNGIDSLVIIPTLHSLYYFISDYKIC